MKRWWPIVVNVLAFDVTWTVVLFLAANGWAWVGAGVMLANVVGYLVWTAMEKRGASWQRELGLIVGFASIGAAIDSVLCSRGVVGLAQPRGVSAEFAVFFFALWANFGTTVRIGFAWAWDRVWAGVVFGLVGGPLGYLIGERIGAVTIGQDRAVSLGIFSVEFAVMMGAWFLVAGRVLPRRVA